MARKVLIIDAGSRNAAGVGGTLSHSYAELARKTLGELGHTAEVTRVDREYDIAEEAARVKAADAVIVQTPGWWMSPPWQFKKYEDTVLVQPLLAAGGDGRSRADGTRLYGRGGVNTDKVYMLSSTWNAPLEAFTDPLQFFEGRGIDGVFFPVHKTFQFLGMRPLPSFMANDVLKNPRHEEDFARFVAHLRRYFSC